MQVALQNRDNANNINTVQSTRSVTLAIFNHSVINQEPA
ncbi:hypothetical protein PPEP_a2028 [Pseudoalteromonas peptidolytica F12-50-A1]|uniref:Uncharacterized protein n=1 Tax=Pseudoalteromonas peptidolytica F12-50-A1 TaxID=1315280 RepID=A0A8I0T4L5_9GAMM|nr:hypothetical protein [Pseudoalteromonas peptidolytica F12-50-A1]